MVSRKTKLFAIAFLVLGLLGGLAFVTAKAQRETRQQFEERFALRGVLGATFTSSYVDSVLQAERRRAERALAGANVSEAEFLAVVDALEFHAAVLLDSRGRVLHSWPRKAGLIGTDLRADYPHLRAAVGGTPSISNVVLSAVERRPVVAFATPFASSSGRRVLSGAFGVEGTPLSVYLKTALPIASAELTLVDATGALVIDSGGLGQVRQLGATDADLAAALVDRSSGHYSRDGESRFFSRHAVAGTNWSILVSVPERQLLAPVGGVKGLIPWVLFAALAAAAVAAAALVWRLAEHRTQLARSNRQLARSNEELRDLDRLKDEFVALVSHELRTPLTSILGYISALQRGRAGVMPAEQRQLLDVAERNAKRLLGMIGDLLMAAKADAGKLELEEEPLELGALALQAVQSARPHAEERNVRLELAPGPALPIVADRARLIQVLDNLISNSIKFTPEGGTVSVALSAGPESAVIEVRDDGIGIPAAEQAQLFQRFFRASTATKREIPGSGLGLSIVRTIVVLHRGAIECRSAEGEGTTFVVTLPLATAHEVAA